MIANFFFLHCTTTTRPRHNNSRDQQQRRQTSGTCGFFLLFCSCFQLTTFIILRLVNYGILRCGFDLFGDSIFAASRSIIAIVSFMMMTKQRLARYLVHDNLYLATCSFLPLLWISISHSLIPSQFTFISFFSNHFQMITCLSLVRAKPMREYTACRPLLLRIQARDQDNLHSVACRKT